MEEHGLDGPDPGLGLIALSFTVVNRKTPSDDVAYLYIAADKIRSAEFGNMMITMRNRKSQSIEVTGSSLLNIVIDTALLSEEDVRAIRLDVASMETWTLEAVGMTLSLRMRQGKTCTITGTEPQSIGLTGLLASSGQPLIRNFAFEWHSFSGIEDESRSVSITRDFPPHQEDAEARIGCRWGTRKEYVRSNEDVYWTPYEIRNERPGIANYLILRIENTSTEALVPAGTEFFVRFPTQSFEIPAQALCTEEQLKTVTCEAVEQPGGAWEIEKISGGRTTYWVLRPGKDATEVFGGKGFVNFRFGNLVTKMPDGTVPAVISWHGIKGKRTGYALTPVSKAAPVPYMSSFTASRNGTPLVDGQTVGFKDEVLLRWDLFAVDGCLIPGLGEFTGKAGSTVVRPAQTSNQYVLIPKITLDGVQQTGNPGLLRFAVGPPTTRMWSEPALLLPGQTKATLHWECTNGDCTISGPNLPAETVTRSGSKEVTAGWTAYQVECRGASTATARTTVQVPTCMIWHSVHLHAEGQLRVEWKASNAASCQVRDINSPKPPFAEGLEGDIVIPSTKASLQARGNGFVEAYFYFGMSPRSVSPTVQMNEYRSGDKHVFTWRVEGADMIRASGPGWRSAAMSGSEERDYRGGGRKYELSIRTPSGIFYWILDMTR